MRRTTVPGRPIVLIGMMGCGKTTVGRILARQLGLTQIDIDSYVEERQGRTVAELFAEQGEARFRELETAAAAELAERRDVVLSCGGGLPTVEASIAPLHAAGTVFWLDRDPGEIYDGLDVSGRPLAQRGREDFLARCAARAPIYRRWAHHVIRAESAEAAAAAICAIWEEEA